MNRDLVWGLSSCLLGLLCLGCSSNNQIIRGQSPNTAGIYHGQRGVVTKFDAWTRRPHYTQISTGPGGQEQVGYLTKDGLPVDIDGNYFPCEANGQCSGECSDECSDEGRCCLNKYCPFPTNYKYPTHVHTFSYYPPKDLRYPQPNTPAAVIQYPYYTVKGPDDFFLN